MGSSSPWYDESGDGGKEMIEIWQMLGAGELTRERPTFLVAALPPLTCTKLAPVEPMSLSALQQRPWGEQMETDIENG